MRKPQPESIARYQTSDPLGPLDDDDGLAVFAHILEPEAAGLGRGLQAVGVHVYEMAERFCAPAEAVPLREYERGALDLRADAEG